MMHDIDFVIDGTQNTCSVWRYGKKSLDSKKIQMWIAYLVG